MIEYSNDGGTTWFSAADGIDIPFDAASVKVRLATGAGRSGWYITATGTSDDPPGVSVVPSFGNADATISFSGSMPFAATFLSHVDGESPTLFAIYRVTPGGNRLLAAGEGAHGSALYGWVPRVNRILGAAEQDVYSGRTTIVAAGAYDLLYVPSMDFTGLCELTTVAKNATQGYASKLIWHSDHGTGTTPVSLYDQGALPLAAVTVTHTAGSVLVQGTGLGEWLAVLKVTRA